MRLRTRLLTGIALVGLWLYGVSLPDAATAAPLVKAEAVVLVNSASPSSRDFETFIQPYLDHFGVPYTTLDIARAPVDAHIADYALIIVGQQHLDITRRYLDAGEQQAIASAVRTGTGLVNFDSDLWENGVPRYQFVQDIFGMTPGSATVETDITFPASGRSGMHYISAAHQPGETLKTRKMHVSGFTLPASSVTVVLSGTAPLVSTAEFGEGHAVQWASYDWMSHTVLGPLLGLDDVVWRSVVWAARKPFVMQALPPIVTMRVDDALGPFGWVRVANEFALKPWLGIFLGEIKDSDATDLRSLVHAGNATASMHGFDANTFLYFNHHDHLRVHLGFDAFTSRLTLGSRVVSGLLAMALVALGAFIWWRSAVSGRVSASVVAGLLIGLAMFIKLKIAQALIALLVFAVVTAWRAAARRMLTATVVVAVISILMFGVWSLGLRRALIGPGDWPTETIGAKYAQATRWHTEHDIPISRFVVPHFYEFGTNAFAGLAHWGVEFVGTQVTPGVAYGGPWLRSGPYRKFEDGNSERSVGSYYADFLDVPGHPEYDGRFFNCVTEIRDDNGYEWSPTPNIDETVGHGTRQLKRALDSRALASLFTHEYYLASIPEANWRSILQQVTTNVAAYHPRYMTMDDACQYVRALHTSAIASSEFEPETGAIHTTLAGASDIATTFSLFSTTDGTIVERDVAVPPFSGSTQVSTSVVRAVSARSRAE